MIEFVDQNEADALVAGAEPAPAARPEPRAWTFAPAPRVSRGQRAPLEAALRAFARDVEAQLTSLFQTPIEFRFEGLETAPVAELLLALEAPCAATPLRLGAGVRGQGVLDFGTAAAFQLVDRLLGGPGDSAAPGRALSALEQAVLATTAAPVVERLRSAWSGVLPFVPEADGFESDPGALRARFAGEEEALVAHFVLADGAFRGAVTLGLPAGAVADALASRPAAPARGGAAGASAVEAALRSARVAVSARLPQIRLSARELARLAEGQVIHTSQPVDGPLEVLVNGRPRFIGNLGRVRANIGVRITGPVEGAAAQAARPREGRVM
jgi:flagellar motor switch protein FliM